MFDDRRPQRAWDAPAHRSSPGESAGRACHGGRRSRSLAADTIAPLLMLPIGLALAGGLMRIEVNLLPGAKAG